MFICTHFEVKHPWVMYPYLFHRYDEDATPGIVWKPATGIRECCISKRNGLALAAWWWDVSKRFEDLKVRGLEDQSLTKALLEQLPVIEEILEDVVPKPTVDEMQGYLNYRDDLGLLDELPPLRRRRVPSYAKVLGFDSWPCTEEELNKRWKELALQHHPDRNGDPIQFMRCKEAYIKAKTCF